ncbi:hypothetical protein LEP1GSC051_3826 [Leptospira sp. P2653]|nr:hypothetical protein LEP1GSC051_3826 [Leptospira sp. P2653]
MKSLQRAYVIVIITLSLLFAHWYRLYSIAPLLLSEITTYTNSLSDPDLWALCTQESLRLVQNLKCQTPHIETFGPRLSSLLHLQRIELHEKPELQFIPVFFPKLEFSDLSPVYKLTFSSRKCYYLKLRIREWFPLSFKGPTFSSC